MHLQKIKNYDAGIGVKVNYSPSEHQASHKVWPTRIDNGQYKAFDWSDL